MVLYLMLFIPEINGATFRNGQHIGTNEGYDISVYDSTIIPSISKIDIEYKYKIRFEEYCFGASIGIDDGDCKNRHTGFAATEKTHNYAYAYNGQLYHKKTGIHK